MNTPCLTVYDQLEEACLPLMTHYQTDLTRIDQQYMELHPQCPFLHWTRQTGTQMEFLPRHDDPHYPPDGEERPYLFGTADRVHILHQKVSMARWFLREHICAVHWFDGQRLHRTTVQRAVVIAEDYERSVSAHWKRSTR